MQLLAPRTSCAMAAEAERLRVGAAKRDDARSLQWLQQEMQQKNQKDLRSLAAACSLQQRGVSVDALRKRLVDHFAEEVRSELEWVRVACALLAAGPYLHWSAAVVRISQTNLGAICIGVPLLCESPRTWKCSSHFAC